MAGNMEYTFSLQKLAAYQLRRTTKSKAMFDAGLVVLERGGYANKGEEGAHHYTLLCSVEDSIACLCLVFCTRRLGYHREAGVGGVGPAER